MEEQPTDREKDKTYGKQQRRQYRIQKKSHRCN